MTKKRTLFALMSLFAIAVAGFALFGSAQPAAHAAALRHAPVAPGSSGGNLNTNDVGAINHSGCGCYLLKDGDPSDTEIHQGNLDDDSGQYDDYTLSVPKDSGIVVHVTAIDYGGTDGSGEDLPDITDINKTVGMGGSVYLKDLFANDDDLQVTVLSGIGAATS